MLPPPTNELIYLASPYTHPDSAVSEMLAAQVSAIAAQLIKARHLIFCPIAHGHQIAANGDISGSFWQWSQLSIAMLDRCDALWICTLSGWDTSTGIYAERSHALKTGKPVFTICPSTLKLTPASDKRTSS